MAGPSEQKAAEAEWLEFIRRQGLEMLEPTTLRAAQAGLRMTQTFSREAGEVFEAVDPVGNVQRLAERFQRHVDNLSVSETGTNANGVRLNNSAVMRGVASSFSQKSEEEKFKDFVAQLSLQQYIDDLRKQANWYDEKARELGKEIDANNEERQKNFEFIEEANDLLDEYQRTGKIDKNRAKKILNARDINFDDNADDSVYAVLIEKHKNKFLKTNERIDVENEEKSKLKNDFEKKRDDSLQKIKKSNEAKNEIISDSSLSIDQKQAQLKELSDKTSIETTINKSAFQKDQEHMEEIKQKYKAEFSATEEEVADEEAEFLATVGDKFNSAFSKSAALPDPNSGLAAETKKLAVNEPAAHAAKFEGLT